MHYLVTAVSVQPHRLKNFGPSTQSTGRIAAVSQSLLNRYDKGMVCTNFCKALKPRPGYSMFVYYYWQYLYDKNVFFSYENGTTGIKNLDISSFIETEPIVLPPQNLVSKFDSFCQSLFNIILGQSFFLCGQGPKPLPSVI